MSANKIKQYTDGTVRAKFWDYSEPGQYFITVCTHQMTHWFGSIEDGSVHLSPIGEIVKEEWLQTFKLRTDMNLDCGEYVVMPNHFHAIIGIGVNEYNGQTMFEKSLGPRSKNLSAIVRSFKAAVTRRAKEIDPNFKWQPKYYDRIIRNQHAYDQISRYIINNPRNWRT